MTSETTQNPKDWSVSLKWAGQTVDLHGGSSSTEQLKRGHQAPPSTLSLQRMEEGGATSIPRLRVAFSASQPPRVSHML